ncbi:hypothetical protein [Marilutibacter aestuarii]|uniref:Uncharacterized protein n=1 Tax=Marilutibacter aestuarii TaxID=1706195 RepID=A0A508A030_9GAMM|nr:hypothetical protein [Lysobacter aestuarii]TQD43366.1 hypothetical protein FKV25_10700 [Lysobacter aestuarii]
MGDTRIPQLRPGTAWVATLLLAGSFGPAVAGGLVVCNDCSDPAGAAGKGGAGTVLVSDFQGRKLWAFENRFDSTAQRYRSQPRPVPASIAEAFARIANITDAAQAVITARQGVAGPGMAFPDGFEDANAALVAADSDLQELLGTALARRFAGAGPGSATLNDLAFELTALGLEVTGRSIGLDGVTINLVWRDGSRTLMKLRRDAITRAEYVSGASEDADGNKLPDSSIASDGGSYVGEYRFSDRALIDDWLHAAAQFGIPIAGTPGPRMSCIWENHALACHFH